MNLCAASRSSSLSQRLSCSLSRSTSTSSRGDVDSDPAPPSYGKLALVCVGIVVCLIFALQASHQQSSTHFESALGRRDSKNIGTISRDTVLQKQLSKANQEIAATRARLEAVLATSAVKETILRAQGSAITLLQQRYDHERAARSRAQVNLSLQLQSLTKCAAEFEVAEREVLQCANSIRDRLGIARRNSL